MLMRLSLLAAGLLGSLFAWLVLHWYEEVRSDAPYSLIEDRLYVGSAVSRPPRGTRAVLNLCQQEDSYEVDKVRWDPIDGTEAPSIEWLQRNVEFIDAQRRAGVTTYVHCLAGMNRSGMVVTAYLMYEHGWTRDQALRFAQSKRPQIQPNPTLMRLLDDWERHVANKPR
jgi:hypothetical protein